MAPKLPCTLVWLRRDLRVIDNPALYHAAKRGHVVTVYILDEQDPGKRKMGEACLWWLYHSLKSLQNQLSQWNVPLILATGDDTYTILINLLQHYNADTIYWNRCYEPFEWKRDNLVQQRLKTDQVNFETYQDRVMYEPWTIKNGKGKPFQIFPCYWNQCLSFPEPRKPYSQPQFKNRVFNCNDGDKQLQRWQLLLSQSQCYRNLLELWCPGEKGAIRKLRSFMKSMLQHYSEKRDCLCLDSTSKLSPHLHFGEISPFTIWHTAYYMHHSCVKPLSVPLHCAKRYLTELGWREYTCYLLFHFPDLPEKCFKSIFDELELKNDQKNLRLWQEGNTGYPIIDAGMRQLLQTGFMHNRIRTITASFLTKHLLIPWQKGEQWFWKKLVDADLAQSACNWQWIAGCGPDVAPYFRMFNPVIQGEKYDADGHYVRRWVPEIAKLPNTFIQKPWEAPKAVLDAANITLGKTYPQPIVEHKAARELAMATFARLKRKQDSSVKTKKRRKKSKSGD